MTPYGHLLLFSFQSCQNLFGRVSFANKEYRVQSPLGNGNQNVLQRNETIGANSFYSILLLRV